MASLSPQRPSRRAASRRKAVIESDDDEDAQFQQPSRQADSDEEGFVPAAKSRSPRKSAASSTRRKTAASDAATPRTAPRTRRTRASESVEPSRMFTPPADDEQAGADTRSPVKKAESPKKKRTAGRQSVRANRRARESSATSVTDATTEAADVTQAMLTPKDSLSPEPSTIEPETTVGVESSPHKSPVSPPPSQRSSVPLGDITDGAVNELRQPVHKIAEAVKVDPNVTKLEKPMDIVVRTRQAALPTVQEDTGPKTRIVITYLILKNFKSYAGRQEVGPFHASFSSVVGPNGSGKSNVIDSLLFVFGFRASKMRQGKLSALIHNSAAHPDLDHCEVEVHFQEVKDLPNGTTEVVPDSTLIISRRAFKNNSSNYYINGKTSNFTTVTTLLRDRGVDLDHKRFLILQGEVESIAQMKPKAANEHDDGLLEYLEDIIGTSKYKTPIEESATETEQLNEVCLEKSNRVQHVEKEKNSLEEKKNKALGYIRDENELAHKKSALYQICLEECKDTLQVSEEATAELQKQLDEELLKHKGNEGEIKRLDKQYKAGLKEADNLRKQAESLAAELATLDKGRVEIEERKKFILNKRKKLEKTMQTGSFAISEAETNIKQCNDDIERNTAQISDLEANMKKEEAELVAIRESLKGKTQGLSDEIAAKQKSLEPWNEKINQKESAIAVAQSELDILKERDSANAVNEVKEKLASIESTREAKAAELEECRTERAQVEQKVKKIQAKLDALSAEDPSMRSALSEARQKAEEARSNLSASQTTSNVLEGLMRLKESGRISGFHGRLGNLGVIDKKYDVAISTACPALDNLVVDSVEVGQQCIDYLRKNNLGRANFICLDRLPCRDLSAIDTPENAPRLFDLVKFREDRFRPAFFSVLQNTLVAGNLEQANRVAYGSAQRWRVVTLDGQLIDKSGTMSGGGTRVAKGGMSSKAEMSRAQVEKLEVDRDALEQRFQEHQAKQRDLANSLRECNDQGPALETKAQKLELEITSLDRNIADVQKRIQELLAQRTSQADKARMVALEKTIAASEKEIAKLRSEMEGMEEDIKALQDKIMEIGGVRLRSQKAKVDGLKEQIDTLTEEISSAEVARAKHQKKKEKQEKAQADAEKAMGQSEKDMEKVEGDEQKKFENTSGIREAAEEAEKLRYFKNEYLQDLKNELDDKTKELNETRGIEIEIRNKLEENQKALSDAKRRLASWEEKLGKLAIQNISDLGGEPDDQEASTLPTYTPDELSDMDKSALNAAIHALEHKLSNMTVDASVLSEYRRRVDEHAARSADLAGAVAARDTAKRRCDELRRLRLEGFMEGFSAISLRLKEMYQMITMGGNAELELVDSLDPFAEGILFSVMPPKKSWKNISNLSGGEKTLSSLALVFALHHYRPTPLYVMDEIDAALDFRNVSIVASYIKERTKNAQFIVISLRNNMFELAARLVGVYKVNHMTKSVTVENKDYIRAQA